MPIKLLTKPNLRKYLGFFGLYLLLVPNGTSWYWGNMAVYTNSFLRAKFGPGSGTPWVISLNTLGWAVGLLAAGKMIQKYGLRYSLISGVLACELGMFLSYVLIMHFSWALWVTMGFMTGLGQGFIYNSNVAVIAVLCPGNVGSVTGIAMTGLGVGSTIVIQLSTWYVNPDNLLPDISDGQILLFSQRKVLDKVPSFFLILGIWSLFTHWTGIVLAKSALPPEKPSQYEDDTIPLVEDVLLSGGLPMKTECQKQEMNFDSKEYKTSATAKSLETKEVVKALPFYIMWMCAFFADYAFDVIMNFYKLYGQKHIKDDHFLTYLSSCMVICNMSFMALWGFLFDKAGFKYTVIIFMSLTSILFSFVYFTPMVNRFLFSLFAMLLGGISIGTYMIFALGALELYGPNHFSQINGLVMTSTVVVNIFAPNAMMFFLQNFGWFPLFFSAAFGSCVMLFLSVIFFPKG